MKMTMKQVMRVTKVVKVLLKENFTDIEIIMLITVLKGMVGKKEQ